MGITMLVTMAQLAFFYMVPYFVLLAFGKHDVDFISCLAAGAFIQLLSSAVPLPGGTGGAEGGFALFLGHFFGPSATAGYLVWRIITFFGPTILTAPLLGLRSAHHASIHARWNRLVHGGRAPERKKAAGAAGASWRMIAPELPKPPFRTVVPAVRASGRPPAVSPSPQNLRRRSRH